MKEYNDRIYRQRFSEERWVGFVVKYKETDVWIGVDKTSFCEDMPAFAETVTRTYRTELDTYIFRDEQFGKSLEPYPAQDDAPEMAKRMSEVSYKAGVGPMAAVAGAFAMFIGDTLAHKYKVNEIIVENGGDIYADIKEDMDVAIFAGESTLSEKVGLRIKAENSPLGICTSSGTVGPSLSFGTADAVMIVCKNTSLADAYATGFANRIQSKEDVSLLAQEIETYDDILGALLVKDDQMGIVGEFELKLFA